MTWLREAIGRPHPPRVAIIGAAIASRRPARYLEVGVNTGVVFLHVRAARKVAVDPQPAIPRWKWRTHPNALLRGRLVRATSDAYFDDLAAGERFDVVFVDGDHTFAQTLRDIESALDHLAAGGVVMVHDCDPPTAAAASPDPLDAGDGPWCGEAWKAIAHLRATRADLSVTVLATDCGIGVIERRASTPIDLEPQAIAAMDWDDLVADRERLLGPVAV